MYFKEVEFNYIWYLLDWLILLAIQNLIGCTVYTNQHRLWHLAQHPGQQADAS